MARARTDSTFTRSRYRQLVYGIAGLGIVALLVGMVGEQHLAGAILYLLAAWLGGGIAVLVPRWSDAHLQDERDYELHERASGLAMGVTMGLGLGLLPAFYVLDAGGYVELAGAPAGAVGLASALFVLYGVCFGIVQRRG